MRRHWLLLALLVSLLALAAAGCGGDDEEAAPPAEPAPAEPAPAEPAPAEPAETGEPAPAEPAAPAEDVSGEISIMGVWQDVEAEHFEAVLDGFREQYPDVTVTYDPAGDDLPTLLTTAIEGGNPPDLAAPAQPGFIAELATAGDLLPLEFLRETVVANYGESVAQLAEFEDQLYGFLFKASSKSLGWYNVAAFEAAGVEPPATFEDLTAAAETIKASGLPAYSIAGADGWTLTDLFENIYVRSAGADAYDQLSRHEIPWTDQSVKDALALMAQVVGDPENLAGGTEGALQTDFPTSVGNVLAEDPSAAMVLEGIFVPGVVESPLTYPDGYNSFEFPSIEDSPGSIITDGNFIVMLRDSPAAQALATYLASPEAAQIWAERGGYITLNTGVDPSVYPDPVYEETATAIAEGEVEVVKFDLSDLQPGAFGATVGQGLWKLFQDFIANPEDVDGIAQQMEDAASAAYGG
jgi:alpha-glucoside transport system substrate-binding protein